MARCLVTRGLPGAELDRLRELHDVELWSGELPPERAWLLEHVRGVEGLLCLLTDRIDAEVIAAATELRVISNFAVGCDNIDLAAAAARGIPVGCTPDVLTDATADLTMALMLAVARHLPSAERDARAGRWRTWEPSGWLGLELRGATLAIVGAGRIGRAVAERARAFGMDVRLVGRGSDLTAALAGADIVSLHAPLTDATHHLIDETALGAMRPSAILINTSRGGLVDQIALGKALAAGAIAGAGLDVTDPEPLPVADPLMRAPNLIVLPHIGSATHAARGAMTRRAVENLIAGLEGNALPYPQASRQTAESGGAQADGSAQPAVNPPSTG
jgi:glyoxylate reductase